MLYFLTIRQSDIYKNQSLKNAIWQMNHGSLVYCSSSLSYFAAIFQLQSFSFAYDNYCILCNMYNNIRQKMLCCHSQISTRTYNHILTNVIGLNILKYIYVHTGHLYLLFVLAISTWKRLCKCICWVVSIFRKTPKCHCNRLSATKSYHSFSQCTAAQSRLIWHNYQYA